MAENLAPQGQRVAHPDTRGELGPGERRILVLVSPISYRKPESLTRFFQGRFAVESSPFGRWQIRHRSHQWSAASEERTRQASGLAVTRRSLNNRSTATGALRACADLLYCGSESGRSWTVSQTFSCPPRRFVRSGTSRQRHVPRPALVVRKVGYSGNTNGSYWLPNLNHQRT